MTPRSHEPAALDDALARWDPSTGIDVTTARAQTRRAATLLATTGDRLGRTDLADRLADGSTFDARTWWTDAVGPGIRRLGDDADREEVDVDPEPVPETDPRHIDPAGDLADAVESGDLDLSLADDQDAEDLREVVDAAERGELGPVDPGLEAQVRIARALLEDLDDDGEDA
jgi:hypothetical protein